MGKAQRRARLAKGRSTRERVEVPAHLGPTPEQARRAVYVVEKFNENESGAISLKPERERRVPVIDTMRKRNELTEEQHKRLSHYRDQAGVTDYSYTKDSLADRTGAGCSSWSKPPSVLSAELEVSRIERDLGTLQPFARAICVDDRSIDEWLVEKYGGRERYDGRGKFIAIVCEREVERRAIALMELRIASTRIVW